MPRSKSKSKLKTRGPAKKFQPTKQLFVGIVIAALVIFVIFLLEFQGNKQSFSSNKADADSQNLQIDPASDMTVDSPFGY